MAVFPVPVAPSSVWNRFPAATDAAISSIARGWSPVGLVVRGDPQLAHPTQRTHAVRSSHGRIPAAANVAFRPLRGRRRRGRRLRGKLGGGRPSRSPAVSGAGAGPGHARRVERALRARQDVWGNQLLRSRTGPTYDAVRRYLPPLVLARAPGGRPLTESGVHYLAFGRPAGPQGSGSVPLHVADGSQIVSRRWQGRSSRSESGVADASDTARVAPVWRLHGSPAATCRSCKPRTPTQQAPATGRSRSSRRSRGVARWPASCGSPWMLTVRQEARRSGSRRPPARRAHVGWRIRWDRAPVAPSMQSG